MNALNSFTSESVPLSDIRQMTELQAVIHQNLRRANQDVSEFNQFSAEQHAQLSGRLARHVATLQHVHSELFGIFQRVRVLRGEMLRRHPEFAGALERHEAAREAELEVARQQGSSKVASTPAQSTAASESAETVGTRGQSALGQNNQQRELSTKSARNRAHHRDDGGGDGGGGEGGGDGAGDGGGGDGGGGDGGGDHGGGGESSDDGGDGGDGGGDGDGGRLEAAMASAVMGVEKAAMAAAVRGMEKALGR